MATYKLNEVKIFADITDGIAVLIDSDTGIYYGMNGFATNIYENLEKGISTEKILEKLNTLPGVPATIEEELNTFVEIMVEKNVLIEIESNDAEADIDEELAKEDDYVLEFKEYDDAQELLLSDPIHEVKEETGWTGEKDSIGYTKEETKEREKKMEDE